MIDIIYIEQDILTHPRSQSILQRFPDATIVHCSRYTEIFNRKGQNFRLQKKHPALILAKKFQNHVLPTPEQYGIGARNNYYFSHMLNCIYDCRYCFLQGMFRSANYVLFINYEDFGTTIRQIIHKHKGKTLQFFSGYDCDSLALDPVSGFVDYILPLFQQFPEVGLELRTKSTQIRSLLEQQPVNNCIVAWSFTPEEISRYLEHKTPAISNRIEAIRKVQEYGWQVGLRFDPLIYTTNYKQAYQQLFRSLFNQLDIRKIHSVSLGSFRLPRDYFQTMWRLYPDEPLFASSLEDDGGMVSYKKAIRDEMLEFCGREILSWIPRSKFFPCHEISL